MDKRVRTISVYKLLSKIARLWFTSRLARLGRPTVHFNGR